ncbi:MAG: NUDIX hydrolase [Bacteroidales bacterium]
MKYSIYNVYHKLLITDNRSLSCDKDMIFYEPFDWDKIISLFNEKSLCLITTNPDYTFKEFQSKYERIEAAGCLVVNEKQQWLMIYRLNHWDLPKGKIDAGESPLQTAIREIKEECNLSINAEKCTFFEHTYHVYQLNNKPILKQTHWYLCHYNQNHSDLIPQTEENIEKVEWVNLTQWTELKKISYPSIVQVVDKYIQNIDKHKSKNV